MNKRILIIDDDTDMVDILTLLLTDHGYEIETMINAEGIPGVINQFHPDLILLDVMLAGADGFTVCKSIKADPATQALPVILISGMQGFRTYVQLHDAPDDYIEKPFDLELLLKRVEKQLAFN